MEAPTPDENELQHYSVYRPERRLIYHYFDGQRVVPGDPLVIHRRLMKVWPSISQDLEVLTEGGDSPEAGESHERIAETVRGVLNLKPVIEGGPTESELVGLLHHFLTYCQTLHGLQEGGADTPKEG